MRKHLLIIMIVCISCVLCSCKDYKYEYKGEHLDLYTLALNMIPGAKGFEQSEIRFDPTINVLEEDSYGRILFTYFEGNNISTYSMLIMQYSAEGKVYYYSGMKFISSSTGDFSIQDKEIIKNQNDWNQDLEHDQMVSLELSNTEKISPLTYEQIKPFYEKIFPDEQHFPDERNLKYYTTDNYGRILICAEGRIVNEWAIIMFYPDGTYEENVGFRVFSDFFSYQNDFIEFLSDISWNQPLENEIDS